MTNETIDAGAMMAVHDGLRKEFASLPLLVKSIAEGDAARAATVADHIELLIRVLVAHHVGEDQLLWPLVEARAPEVSAAVQEMADEHQVLDDRLSAIKELTTAWRLDPSATCRASLHTALIAFERTLLNHLGHEEVTALPIAARVITAEEYVALEARLIEALSANQLAVVLGLILDDTNAEHGQALLTAVGPQARADFEESGRGTYRAYRASLLGG
jgi:iron-sulfur cluster repair protein YtfE (RIC family)